MDTSILEKVEKALSLFYQRDIYLLIHDLNERTIAHKFAVYLQAEFDEMDVDCEYNKNIDEASGSKIITIDRVQAEKYKRSSRNEVTIDDIEHAVISIYPDIVVHKRGQNTTNLLIVEIKKSTSQVDREFDRIKLECYTSNDNKNKLNYQLGLFIEFETKVPNPQKPKLVYFKSGNRVLY